MHSDILALARYDLAVYAAAMWPGFELAPHHKLLIEAFESMERGEVSRLAASTPPRHGKSLLAQLFVASYLGKHPDRSVIVASYAQDLADDFGRRVRNFIQDDRHRSIFPHCQLTADSAAMHRFSLTSGGSFYAVGRGAAITGRGADLALVDDLFKDRAEAVSDAIRRSVHEWYAHVFYTRLHPQAPVGLIGTRWHEDDVHGRQVRQQPGLWKVLNLPAIVEQNESFRLAGAALWPSRYPLAVLHEIRTTIGGNAFACLYQGAASSGRGRDLQA
jgi:hypothetical protein